MIAAFRCAGNRHRTRENTTHFDKPKPRAVEWLRARFDRAVQKPSRAEPASQTASGAPQKSPSSRACEEPLTSRGQRRRGAHQARLERFKQNCGRKPRSMAAEVRGAHPSRVLVSASRRNELPCRADLLCAANSPSTVESSSRRRGRLRQHPGRVCSPEALRATRFLTTVLFKPL